MPYEIRYTINKGYKVYVKHSGLSLSHKYFKTYEQALKQLQAVAISEHKRK